MSDCSSLPGLRNGTLLDVRPRDSDQAKRTAENRRKDRQQAVRDLIATGSFLPEGLTGPFMLELWLKAGRLVFDIRDAENRPLEAISLPLSPLRGILKDYNRTLDGYAEALASGDPRQVRAFDYGRSALHDEAAATLQQVMAGHIRVDSGTARRLFTLVALMAARD